ncbi:HEAT repeat domain-containing protein [Nocardia huaxiensis]|uniref:HEAT repeat domain-containing protein n=1 Tax=Nocardia huaxiensis TaxID=2755382 RepID=UPI001E5A106C|nr:HEAT repeat domain-containing protein [Nocardia huaxiensis]UFS93683.1 HEAT repeat domain-containing protein [Nocardia huaxiensis]
MSAAVGDSDIGELLERLARGEDGWAIRAVTERLAVRHDAQARDALLVALERGRGGVAHCAAAALARHGGRWVVGETVRCLRTSRNARFAAFVLGELRAVEATPVLLRRLTAEVDELTGVACAEALGKIAKAHIGQRESMTAPLLEAARHPAAPVRAAVLIVLGVIGGPEVVEPALAATDDFDPRVRERAVRVLARWGDRRVSARLAALCDGPYVDQALIGLLRVADPRVAPTVVEVFRTTAERRTLYLAGRVLAACGAPFYYHGTDPVRRRILVWVRGRCGSARDRWWLEQQLLVSDSTIRARAAEALGLLGLAAEPVYPLLADRSPVVRAYAATALGRAGRPAAAAVLRANRSDPDRQVRAAVAAALAALSESAKESE